MVKSSRGDVKQAHAEPSPQVQKEMKYRFDFCFTFLSTMQPPSLSILPLARFINVILEIVCIMYVRFWSGVKV